MKSRSQSLRVMVDAISKTLIKSGDRRAIMAITVDEVKELSSCAEDETIEDLRERLRLINAFASTAIEHRNDADAWLNALAGKGLAETGE